MYARIEENNTPAESRRPEIKSRHASVKLSLQRHASKKSHGRVRQYTQRRKKPQPMPALPTLREADQGRKRINTRRVCKFGASLQYTPPPRKYILDGQYSWKFSRHGSSLPAKSQNQTDVLGNHPSSDKQLVKRQFKHLS